MNDPQQLVLDMGLSFSQALDLLLHSKSMGTLDLGLILNLNGFVCAFEEKIILLSCSHIHVQKAMTGS